MIDLLVALLVTTATTSLEAGVRANQEFRGDEAIALLERARTEGPYTHSDFARLYEQLGIAYARAGRAEEAESAFSVALTLDHARAISYTLSPKVTFVFERVRQRLAGTLPPMVHLGWPRTLGTHAPVGIDVQVVSNPGDLIDKGRLFWRVRGRDTRASSVFALGTNATIQLPAPAPEATSDQTLELHFVAYDAAGNEVLRWFSEEQPRELRLRYLPPEHWYDKWWTWAIASTAIAAAAGTSVFLLTREPPATVDTRLRVVP